MSDNFTYTPPSKSNETPNKPDSKKDSSSSVGTLILPDAAQKAEVNYSIFGSFAGPIPEPQVSQAQQLPDIQNPKTTTKPNLRLILGNRVTVAPANK